MSALIQPPHAAEAEQAVLGALLLAPEAFHEVADLLTAEAFYLSKHRVIFQAIVERVSAQRTVEAFLLEEELLTAKAPIERGDLVDMAGSVASAANIRGYAELVVDKYLRRQVLAASHAVGELAFKAGSGTDAVGEAAKAIGAIRLAQTGGLVMARQVMAETYVDLTQRYEAKQEISGLSTGLADLDNLLGGLQEEELIILAARPSMGKTALALNIAEAACTQGKAVAVFSLEMSRKQLGQRLIASVGAVNLHGLRTPAHMREEDWPRVVNAQAIVQGWTLALDDSASLSLPMIRARCLRMHARHKLGLVVIDYLQLIEMNGDGDNRANAVAEVSRGLKKLAKELKCPVIALSQLNRSVEQRADKRPMMSDLRDSGNIEEFADVVMFLYRDDYYYPERAAEEGTEGVVEVIFAKQRKGPTGVAKLRFVREYQRFIDESDRAMR